MKEDININKFNEQEVQTTLLQRREVRPSINLLKNPLSLEKEKEKFIQNLCNFLDPLNFDTFQLTGRPRTDFRDIVKSLLIMSYNGMSYRRTQSDLRWMHERELIKSIPPRSTLNDYANQKNTKEIIEKLIQISSLFFIDEEDTAILDSTWFGQKMYTGGFKKVHDKKHAPLAHVRKLHIACLKNSKVIAFAKATEGTKHDSPIFDEAVNTIVKNGFKIKTLLADAGYTGKKNYALCRDLGIFNVFIDFRKNSTFKNAKSDIWREKLRLYKEQREIWNQTYRFRVIVEGIFSAIKKKNLNYLRSKKETAQDVELLLKALVYNLTIIGKYS